MNRRWSIVIGIALILGLLVAGGCSRDYPDVPDLLPGTEEAPPAGSSSAERIAWLEGRLAQEEAAVREQYRARVRSTLAWISIIGLLAAAVAGVAGAVFDVGRKLLWTTAAACLGVVAVAWVFQAVLPYLVWAALGIGAVLVIVVWRSGRLQKLIAKEGMEVGQVALGKLKAVSPENHEHVKRWAVGKQKAAGIHQHVDRLAHKYRPRVTE